MSVNNINHEHCSVCGKSLEFVRTEKQAGGSTLMFYACPEAKPDNDHDRAVYEIEKDVEIS